jgi:hypothetical protein
MNGLNGLKGLAVHLFAAATLATAATASAVTITYNSSAAFFTDLAAASSTATETYEGLALNTLIAEGATVNAFTYTSLPGLLNGIVGDNFSDLGTRSLQLDRDGDEIAAGVDFFFPGETVTLTFAPSNAFGVFINVGTSDSVTDYLSLGTPVGSVTGGGPTPDTGTFFFLGIISDTLFADATFGALASSPTGYNIDNPTIARISIPEPIPEPAGLLLLATALGLLLLSRGWHVNHA